MDKVRVGLIGCGVIGRTHARAAREWPTAELVAVADRIPERAAEYAGQFGVTTTFAEGDDLIDQAEVDAVVLALPACGRTSLGLHALSQGRHLLTEKPVAMNAGEVRLLLQARGDRVAACCSSRFRFLESARVVTRLLADGVLGELRVIRCRATTVPSSPPPAEPPEWRLKRHLNGGGILMNWGCYDLDYILGLTGWSLRPERVLARTWSITPEFAAHAAPESEAETHLTALIRCADGPAINYERGEFVSAPTEGAWSLIGSEATLHLNMLAGRHKEVQLHRGVSGQGTVAEPVWHGDDRSDASSDGPLADLVEAILHDREPSTSLEHALVVQAVSDAIYQSAESGQAADVDLSLAGA